MTETTAPQFLTWLPSVCNSFSHRLKDLRVGLHHLWAFSPKGLLLTRKFVKFYFIITGQLQLAFFSGDSNLVSSVITLQGLSDSFNCCSLLSCHRLLSGVSDRQGFNFPKCMQNVIEWWRLVNLTTLVCTGEM